MVHSALHNLFEKKLCGNCEFDIDRTLIVQFGGKIFRTMPLSLRDGALIIAGTSLVLWIYEISRWIRRQRLS